MVIHENEGPISTIALSSPFVAWCSEYGTKIYNLESETKVCFVEKPKGVPETSVAKPRLCWLSNSFLFIGWGNTLTAVRMSYKTTPAGNKVWYGEINATTTLDYWVCGIGVYDATHVSILGCEAPGEGEPQPP